jgi:hypothetical protein
MGAILYLVIAGGVYALGCCLYSLLDHSQKGRFCPGCHHLIFPSSGAWRSGWLAPAEVSPLAVSRSRAGA